MLPYINIHDAEVALNRELSVVERLWYNYSAKKPDHVLYYHNILFLFLFYSLLPLPYIFMEVYRSKQMGKFRVQSKVKKSFSEMWNCYKSVIQTFILVIGPLQISSYPIIKWIGIDTGLELPNWWEVLGQISVYFMIEDYLNYWIHRSLHSEWGYSNIHRVHHEFTSPMPLAAPYAHWAEVIILGIPSFLGPAIVPCHMLTFWLWFVLRLVEATETHSGYEFPWSPSKYIPFYGGAEYHDYHHFVGPHSRSNFASVFTYCDYIYGTNKGYLYQKATYLDVTSAMRDEYST